MVAVLPILEPGILPKKISWERFLEISEGNDLEWVDGHLIEGEIVRTNHAMLVSCLNNLIYEAGTKTGIGRTFSESALMRLHNGVGSGRCPDVSFILEKHIGRMKADYIDGPVDLAIEVVSPESGRRDRIEKRAEYEAGGVIEYWIIDPEKREAIILWRVEDRFEQMWPDRNGEVESMLLPLKIRVADLWEGLLKSSESDVE